jgi:hemerythrin-like domain-containing protein
MVKEPTPIKRSAQLAALSREHHDSLLFCWKIKQGLGNGTDVVTLRDYILWYWRHYMRSHFIQEEKILLPYIADPALASQLQQEHADIKELILALDNDPDNNLFSILALFVANHIRFEERWLFSYLENILSGDQLNTIADKLSATSHSDKEWAYPFWSRK